MRHVVFNVRIMCPQPFQFFSSGSGEEYFFALCTLEGVLHDHVVTKHGQLFIAFHGLLHTAVGKTDDFRFFAEYFEVDVRHKVNASYNCRWNGLSVGKKTVGELFSLLIGEKLPDDATPNDKLVLNALAGGFNEFSFDKTLGVRVGKKLFRGMDGNRRNKGENGS